MSVVIIGGGVVIGGGGGDVGGCGGVPFSMSSIFVFTNVTSLFTIYLLCLKVELKHIFVKNIGRCMHLAILDCGWCLQYLIQPRSTNGVMNRTIAVHVQSGIITPGFTLISNKT